MYRRRIHQMLSLLIEQHRGGQFLEERALEAAGTGESINALFPQELGHVIRTNAVSIFHALHLNFVSDRIASYAMHGAGAIVLVNVMRIPCVGRIITIGRTSIRWPGAS